MSLPQDPSPQPPVELPRRLKVALDRYRQRLWAVKLAEGVLAALFGLAVSYLAVFGLDRWYDTPAVLRAGLLALGSVGLAVWLPWKCHHWVWRHRHLEQVARLLRRKFPRLGDRLLGIVELAQRGSQPGASRALVEAAMRQVDAEFEEGDFRDAVPHPRHRPWAWAAGVSLALVAAAMAVVPAAGGNALRRWAQPWRVVERYTFAQLESGTALRVVPYAEPFTVPVGLKGSSPWKPAAGTARYESQTPMVAAREGLTYPFRMAPQTRAGRLSVQVGDARRAVAIEPKLRPALTELVARVHLPAYLGRSEPLVEDVRGGTLTAVKGSAVVFQATATRELAAATLDGRPQSVVGSHIVTESVTLDRTSEYRLMWRDGYGLEAREPQGLRVEAIEDRAPTVGLNELKHQRVVLSTESLAFEVQAADDFGVKQVGLVWEGLPDAIANPSPSKGEKVVAAGGPGHESLKVRATFSAERDGIRPQSLRLRAFAEDYLPQRERVYSASLVLHVLTPAEHLKWLTDQLGRWSSAAQEVQERELQLHRINHELLALPPHALDDAAPRKRIREQAAAEQANALALEALVATGATLLQEATRNEEFDAAELQSWADILERLQTIAGERMPTVAGLLAQAAETSVHAAPRATEAPPGVRQEGPADPNASGGGIGVDRSASAEGKAGEQPANGKAGEQPANPMPAIVDHESGFNPGEKAGNAPQGLGGLGVPMTSLKGSGQEAKAGEGGTPTAAALVRQAVTEQQALLEAFARLAGEMNELLLGFENSTFVKRLKAASRKQVELAVELNRLEGFGLGPDESDHLPKRQGLGAREVAASDRVLAIQEDLLAYADRRPSENYVRVLQEMQHATVVEQLRALARTIEHNEIGQATIEAEFWADTLDRWAEQLVDSPGEQGPPSEGAVAWPNLAPELVLEVLRIIHREIDLREQTREAHQSIGAVDPETHRQRAVRLSEFQAGLARRALAVVDRIGALPSRDHPAMMHHMKKLSEAAEAMAAVEKLLATPETGPPTIAAIAEVLEILLETGRVPNAPRVTQSPPASASALLRLGLGDHGSQTSIEPRAPVQATGRAGRPIPAGFRAGLDLYFDALEGKRIE